MSVCAGVCKKEKKRKKGLKRNHACTCKVNHALVECNSHSLSSGMVITVELPWSLTEFGHGSLQLNYRGHSLSSGMVVTVELPWSLTEFGHGRYS